ncbi:MAG: NlpC/P60 family protein, partial [Crocinitomicaceae bacterium]
MNIRLIFTFVFSMLTVQVLASEKDTSSFEPEQIDYCAIEGTAIDNLIDTAVTCIGTPYKYGGSSKEGFDCSGFLGFVFQSYCGDLPRSSSAISQIGNQIER